MRYCVSFNRTQSEDRCRQLRPRLAFLTWWQAESGAAAFLTSVLHLETWVICFKNIWNCSHPCTEILRCCDCLMNGCTLVLGGLWLRSVIGSRGRPTGSFNRWQQEERVTVQDLFLDNDRGKSSVIRFYSTLRALGPNIVSIIEPWWISLVIIDACPLNGKALSIGKGAAGSMQALLGSIEWGRTGGRGLYYSQGHWESEMNKRA